jgi:hypothetical protein
VSSKTDGPHRGLPPHVVEYLYQQGWRVREIGEITKATDRYNWKANDWVNEEQVANMKAVFDVSTWDIDEDSVDIVTTDGTVICVGPALPDTAPVTALVDALAIVTDRAVAAMRGGTKRDQLDLNHYRAVVSHIEDALATSKARVSEALKATLQEHAATGSGSSSSPPPSPSQSSTAQPTP